MSRLHRITDRYAAAAKLADSTVELFVVADGRGSALHSAIRTISKHQRDDGLDLWNDVLSAARQLRWRLITEPIPENYAPDRAQMVGALISHAERILPLVSAEAAAALERLSAAATGLLAGDPPVAPALLATLREIGDESAVVVAVSVRAEVAIRTWLADADVTAPIIRASVRDGFDVVDQAYAVGPPRLFPASLVNAPRALALTCVFPQWEADRSLPVSPLAGLTERPIHPRTRTFPIGDPDPVSSDDPPFDDVPDDLQPTPTWNVSTLVRRLPGEDEVLARKVLLCGGLAAYLDVGGEHIRTLDPAQPVGERVAFTDVAAVSPGTYLVLREGETEKVALYMRALELLGDLGFEVHSSQTRWKEALRARLDELGRPAVQAALKRAGIRRYDRANAWTSITVARPQDSHDFEALLGWLRIPLHPAFAYATKVRRYRSQASADVREALEDALSETSMSHLEAGGYQRLDLELPGFSGIIATRVLAISPYPEPVSRNDIRIPEEDREARWLE